MTIKDKIKHRIKNETIGRLAVLKYKLFSVFKKESGISKQKRKIELIVSLTTYTKRFNVVHLTIESLMNQTVKPDKIILWLAQEELLNGLIPKKILKLKARGLTIRVVNENLKSYKKLIYTVQEFPESNIITCDDDVIYDKNFIEGLYKKHQTLPQHIIAYRCYCVKKYNNNQLKPYHSWSQAKGIEASFNFLFTGVGGVLYPSKSLHKTITDKDLFLTLAPSADDIWFYAMALLNKTKVAMATPQSKHMFYVISGSQGETLWHKNILEGENDKQLKAVFDYFKLYNYIA